MRLKSVYVVGIPLLMKQQTGMRRLLDVSNDTTGYGPSLKNKSSFVSLSEYMQGCGQGYVGL
jgi:hypothetical protein